MRNVFAAVVVVVCAIALPVIGIASSVVLLRMTDDVNQHLPPEERFGQFGWWLGKYRRLSTEYRRFYPGGDRARVLRILRIAGVVALALLVLVLYPAA